MISRTYNTKQGLRFIAITVLIISLIALPGCGTDGGENADTADTEMTWVNMTFVFPNKSKHTDIQTEQLELPKGSTVLDALEIAMEEEEIEVTTKGDPPYVSAIGDTEETGDAGWVYTVNGEMSMDAADEIVVNENDDIVWTYTTFEGDS